jgi:hypothetical protein
MDIRQRHSWSKSTSKNHSFWTTVSSIWESMFWSLMKWNSTFSKKVTSDSPRLTTQLISWTTSTSIWLTQRFSETVQSLGNLRTAISSLLMTWEFTSRARKWISIGTFYPKWSIKPSWHCRVSAKSWIQTAASTASNCSVLTTCWIMTSTAGWLRPTQIHALRKPHDS